MKVLHISLGTHQTSQAKALQDIASEYKTFDWTQYQNNPQVLRDKISQLIDSGFSPDITFMQLQREGLMTPDILNKIPGKKYNWTGDVRDPIPQWYVNIAPYFTATLFSNQHDVDVFRSKGLNAHFLNIGFEEPDYNLNGEKIKSGVVFMGNNYVNQFPLSQFRLNMVNSVLGLQVYGANWNNAVSNLNENPKKEAAIYRGCEIAINLSHFDYDRYSSDRLFRIMACGAFCLSHHYKGIEKDFKVGEHLDTWKTIPELIEKINYWRLRPDERALIAQNGYRKVWANHTWGARIKQLLAW